MKSVVITISILFFLVFSVLSEMALGAEEELKIRSVHFTGNTQYTEETLITKMLNRPSSWPFSWFTSNTYHEAVFFDDLTAIEKFYRDNGFLDAAVINTSIEIDSTTHSVDIHIEINEGLPYQIQNISFFGYSLFSDSTLLRQIQLRPGEIFRVRNLNQSTDAILTLYNERGYLESSLRSEIRLLAEQKRVLIDLYVVENRQSVIGNILIQGNEKTRSSVIHRHITFQTGEIARFSKILESQRKLYQTGLFRSVFISLLEFSETDSLTRDVLIELREETHINFTAGIGYGSLDRLRARTEIHNTNLSGMTRKLGLALKASFIVRSAEISLTEPWTFGSIWHTDVSGLMEFKKEPGYHLNRETGQIKIGREWLQRFRITFSLISAFSRLSQIEIAEETESPKSRKYSFTASFIYDTRNNLFNTQSGIVIDLQNEVGKIDRMGLKNFFQSNIKIKYFYSVSPRTVIGTALEMAWISIEGGRSVIPLHERFYTGGPNSIRGFQNKKVGPLDLNRNPVGGTFKLLWNAFEIKTDIYKMFGLAFFIDMGNVWQKSELFSIGSLRVSPGVGLRIRTPVGTGRVDWGINIDPYPGEPRSCIAISMGQSF